MNKATRQTFEVLKDAGMKPKEAYKQARKWWISLDKSEKKRYRVKGVQ